MKGNRNTTYHHNFTIRPLEANAEGVLKAGVLTDYVQQAAWIHAVKLGVGTPELLSKGYTWVLNRLELEIDHPISYPGLAQIETWPSGVERLFTFRHFVVRDSRQRLCAKARSAWMVVDITKKRAVAPPDFVKNLPYHEEPDNKALYTRKLQEVIGPSNEAAITVRKQDIDLNDHVNNNVIIQWLYEPVEHPGRLSYLDVRFLAECKLGDSLISRVTQHHDACHHSIIRTSDGKEIARATTRWA